MAEDWAGRKVVCPRCKSEDVEYLTDEDHDGGECEVFHCKKCGKLIHVELPD